MYRLQSTADWFQARPVQCPLPCPVFVLADQSLRQYSHVQAVCMAGGHSGCVSRFCHRASVLVDLHGPSPAFSRRRLAAKSKTRQAHIYWRYCVKRARTTECLPALLAYRTVKHGSPLWACLLFRAYLVSSKISILCPRMNVDNIMSQYNLRKIF